MNKEPKQSSRHSVSPRGHFPFPRVFSSGVAGLLLLASCARFSTTQTDLSYDETTGNPLRTITTKASGLTFFSGKSSLASWKASQTDKTQGASVGGLALEGGQTNQLSDIAARITEAAIKAAIKP